jgi:hypothetical protein
MKDQSEFEIGGMVSVWVGNFADDGQFDDYMNLSAEFEKDFGFRIDDRSVREAVVESAPRLIEELVKGFSNWESFAPTAVQAAREVGVSNHDDCFLRRLVCPSKGKDRPECTPQVHWSISIFVRKNYSSPAQSAPANRHPAEQRR